MILEWKDSEFRNFEKLLAVIFDAGMILRQDIRLILDWSEASIRKELYLINQREPKMINRMRPSRKGPTYAYSLTTEGVSYVHGMLGINGKAIAPEGQWLHALGLNDILMRLIRHGDRNRIRWYSTREASDELFRSRQQLGKQEAEIRNTLIRPDALLMYGKFPYWIEFDNATENGRQLLKKYRLYITNLSELPASRKKVIWVTKNEQRRNWMQRLWTDMNDERITMEFYVEGQETAMLTGQENVAEQVSQTDDTDTEQTESETVDTKDQL